MNVHFPHFPQKHHGASLSSYSEFSPFLLHLFQIAKSDAGWTLGYMLNLTNMIPAEPPYVGPLSQASFISIITICSVLVVCVLPICFLIYYKPKCLHKGII